MCKAKFSVRLICMLILFLSALQLNAQNDTITYISKFDSCHKFQILPDGKVFMASGCGHSIDYIGGYTTSDGGYYKGRAVYELKKVSLCPLRADEEQFELYFENSNVKTLVITIINRDSFMIVNHLKTKKGIECHYQSIIVYERSDKIGCFKPDPPENPFKIYIDNYQHNTLILLAMNQPLQSENADVKPDQVMINNGQFAKTSRGFDPVDILTNQHEFYLVNRTTDGVLITEKIPSLRASIPSIYMPIEDRKKAMQMYLPIIKDSKFFIRFGWNPGQSIVNEQFDEEIEGNVMSFMFYSVEEYLKE